MAKAGSPKGAGSPMDPPVPDPLRFVTYSGGKYYLTRELWEYDPNFPGKTPAQEAGVAAIAKLHKSLGGRKRNHSTVKIQTADDGGNLGGGQTSDPNKK